MPSAYEIAIGEKAFTVELDLVSEPPRACIDGDESRMSLVEISKGHFLLRLEGQNFEIHVEDGIADEKKVTVNGKMCALAAFGARERALKAISNASLDKAGGQAIHAPMPGLVLQLLVEEGARVKANDGLAVIEAMKMENEIRAPADGVVAKIAVKEGQPVDKGTVLIQLE